MFMLIVFGFTVPDRSGLFRILVPPHLACVQNGITQLGDWRIETWQLALRARCHVSIRQSPSFCNAILNTCPCLLAIPLHDVSVPAVPEPVTSLLLVYGMGTCTGTVCKTCIERYRIGTLYHIQSCRTGTTYHCWTVLEQVLIDTGMFTGISSPNTKTTPVLYGQCTCIMKYGKVA